MPMSLAQILSQLDKLCSGGYALGLHIRFTSPTYLFQTYSDAWQDRYSSQGFVMRDPTVAWGISETGSRRWSTFPNEDVLDDAKNYGLLFGATAAVEIDGSRSIAGFARGDREFSNTELESLEDSLYQMHVLTAEKDAISDDDRKTLQRSALIG